MSSLIQIYGITLTDFGPGWQSCRKTSFFTFFVCCYLFFLCRSLLSLTVIRYYNYHNFPACLIKTMSVHSVIAVWYVIHYHVKATWNRKYSLKSDWNKKWKSFEKFWLTLQTLQPFRNFLYFVPESRSIIRQYELSDFVTEIRKFWVYDIIDIPETWIHEETNM